MGYFCNSVFLIAYLLIRKNHPDSWSFFFHFTCFEDLLGICKIYVLAFDTDDEMKELLVQFLGKFYMGFWIVGLLLTSNWMTCSVLSVDFRKHELNVRFQMDGRLSQESGGSF